MVRGFVIPRLQDSRKGKLWLPLIDSGLEIA
jgi:hypothetical protein